MPVNPTSIATAGNPQMAAAGNNWARLPQVRVERKIGDHITWQGALLEPQTGDFATNAAFSVQPTSGAASRLPFIQTRIAFADKNWFGAKKAGSIGVSGHYGRSRVFTGSTNVRNDIESVGLALTGISRSANGSAHRAKPFSDAILEGSKQVFSRVTTMILPIVSARPSFDPESERSALAVVGCNSALRCRRYKTD
ncbi:MAG: hypothetical protein IPO41_08830 [Acidobacteria bacterium]|nr:hypothetical protein [Acidobacteriota bacterium]